MLFAQEYLVVASVVRFKILKMEEERISLGGIVKQLGGTM
jgi:hypothetical protein